MITAEKAHDIAARESTNTLLDLCERKVCEAANLGTFSVIVDHGDWEYEPAIDIVKETFAGLSFTVSDVDSERIEIQW